MTAFISIFRWSDAPNTNAVFPFARREEQPLFSHSIVAGRDLMALDVFHEDGISNVEHFERNFQATHASRNRNAFVDF